jgi:hypothetical protein
MRKLACLALFLFACNSDGLPTENGPGASGTPGPSSSTGPSGAPGSSGSGSSGSGSSNTQTVVDLGPTPPNSGGGSSSGGGPAGAICKTACDCQAGLACLQNKCIQSMLGNLYCCESTNCPQGSFCQSTSGGFGMCGGGMGGGGPGGGGGFPPPVDFGVVSDGGRGGGAYCRFVPCQDDARCTMVGCGSCDTSSGRCAAQ